MCLWLVLYVIWYGMSDSDAAKFAFISTLAVSVFFLLVTLTIALEDCTTDYYSSRTGELVAVKNKEGPEGTFIFGTGGFGASTKYRVYVKRNGAAFQEEFDAHRTGVAEDVDAAHAYLETKYSLKRKGTSWARKFLDPDCGCRPVVEGHTLHVPKGTVIQEFKVD